MEYTTDNLEKAVTLFYRSEATQQAEAHKWLTEAQNSPQAWGFVWELLSPLKSSEVQFFAATTLHMKLMKHWAEIPVDHYDILKKKILESIVNYAMGPKIVLNRLCIALAAFVVHTVPVHWPKAFEELVSSFQPHHLPNVEPERVIWILLEILSVIPEEFQTTTLTGSYRNRVRLALQDVPKDILKVVEMCLMPLPNVGFSMSNLTTYLNAARCAYAWIHLGSLNIDECTRITELLLDLTCFVYWNKMEPEGLTTEEQELTEVTVEALSAVIQHPNTNKYVNHVIDFARSMLYKFEKILDTERSSSDPNKDVVTNLYGLIIAMADTHSKIFIMNLKSDNYEKQRISLDLFNSILKCTDLPGLYPVDESSSTLTFGFWYTLQDDILLMSSIESAHLMLMVKPYYRDLLCVMLRKAMYPLNEDSNWSADDKEVFRCYRQDIADTYMYCYNVLNLEMLDILNTKLNEALRKGNIGNILPIIRWNEVETCLHAYCAVAECIEMENLYLPKLMVTIKDIPYSELHIKVMSTALETVGAYSEWIVEHPEVLENVLPLVISAIGNVEVSTSSTMALKDISQHCQKYLIPYADLILVSTQNVLLSGLLRFPECKRLMFSIGKVLSILPPNKVMEYLNVIIGPTIEDLQKLVQADVSQSAIASIGTRLKMLAVLYNALHISGNIMQQPVLIIMQSMMPICQSLSEKYCRDLSLMDDLGCLIKAGVVTLMEDSKPIVTDIMRLLIYIYREYPQHCVLLVAKTIMIMFGKDQDLVPICKEALYEFVNVTIQVCSQYSKSNELSEKVDIFEGFFGLLSHITKKLPDLVFTTGVDMVAVFQCAILCLALPEMQVSKAAASFLVNFIAHSRDAAQTNIIQTYGEGLVMSILVMLGTNAPRTSVEIFSDIFVALTKKYCDNLSRWLNVLLAQENFPSEKISSRHKESFIKVILREKNNKRKLSEAVLEFTLICRGILKEETAEAL